MELELSKLVPEIIVLIAACLSAIVGLSKNDSTRQWAQRIALGATALGFAAAALPHGTIPWISNRFPNANYFAPTFISLLAMGIGFFSILAAWNMPSKSDPTVTDLKFRGEFFSMMLFSIAGVSMIGKVNDLVWLFIVLELVSIPTYIMVATSRSQIVAQEAGVKYFFLGAISAAIFLFGFSYIYGATGATRFDQIAHYFSEVAKTGGSMPMLPLIGILMVLVGVSYKMAAVPLHFYAADVYQGAATPVTAFLAFAPKTAGLIAIIHTLSLFHFDFTHYGSAGQAISSLLTVMAVLTMTVGNVLALLQRNIKRMLAYSSIAHSGYMLVGVVVGTQVGAQHVTGLDASLFYLGAYAIMNLGAFAVLIYLQGKADAGEDIDDLAGVSKEHPAAALALTICLFSLIGMPGTVGFIGKLKIVQSSLAAGYGWLSVIVVINAAIGAAYYLRIVAAMYLRDVWNPFAVRKEFPQRFVGIVCTVAVVVFGIIPHLLVEPTKDRGVPAPITMNDSSTIKQSSALLPE